MELTFEFDGEDHKCRRINFGDLKAARELIRKERLKALGPHAGSEVIAKTVAQPVPQSELLDYILSAEGSAWVLTRCSDMKQDQAEAMVMADDDFLTRLFVESKLIADPTQSPSATSKTP